MARFLGDYICRVDDKGRLLFPAAFKKQMQSDTNESFIIKKDIYENCLVIFPNDEWERQIELIRKRLNPYNKEHNAFLRAFYKGTAEVSLDSASRLLIPKRLLEEVEIEKDIVLAGQDNKIELWSKSKYDNISVGADFADLAEKIMGNNNLNSDL